MTNCAYKVQLKVLAIYHLILKFQRNQKCKSENEITFLNLFIVLLYCDDQRTPVRIWNFLHDLSFIDKNNILVTALHHQTLDIVELEYQHGIMIYQRILVRFSTMAGKFDRNMKNLEIEFYLNIFRCSVNGNRYHTEKEWKMNCF